MAPRKLSTGWWLQPVLNAAPRAPISFYIPSLYPHISHLFLGRASLPSCSLPSSLPRSGHELGRRPPPRRSVLGARGLSADERAGARPPQPAEERAGGARPPQWRSGPAASTSSGVMPPGRPRRRAQTGTARPRRRAGAARRQRGDARRRLEVARPPWTFRAVPCRQAP